MVIFRPPSLRADKPPAGKKRDSQSLASPAGVEPIVLPFTVLYDHRERAGGWKFSGMVGDSSEKYRPLIVPQKVVCLKTADYTIEGVPVFVERKSKDDYIGSVSGGHANFRLEHQRMAEIIANGGVCCVICEGGYAEIMDELASPECLRGTDPATIEGVVSSWPCQFGVPHIFAGTREYAEQLALKFLRKWYSNLTGSKVMFDLSDAVNFTVSFNTLATHINDWAERKGWNEDDPMRMPEITDGKARMGDDLKRIQSQIIAHDISKVALMGTELAEAVEGIRHGNPPSDKIPEFSAVEEELADCIVRICHFAKQRNYRVAEALIAKLAYNEKRPYKHGKLA